ncbi:hypothetical protein HMPREF1870_00684 [Bacteroidales bacterium KA00344]|nr:hypothetical protein HMPREF1870_00684 [Bacteroidales bacterium KA00344]
MEWFKHDDIFLQMHFCAWRISKQKSFGSKYAKFAIICSWLIISSLANLLSSSLFYRLR